jgi:hypothetical protein
MALARALDAPLLVTFHGQDATIGRSEALRRMRRGSGHKDDDCVAGGFIAVSSFIRQRLLEDGYPEQGAAASQRHIDHLPRIQRSSGGRSPSSSAAVEKKGVRYLIEGRVAQGGRCRVRARRDRHH